MVSFKYRPIKFNHSSRNGKKILYIVVHDTANAGKGANAMAHYRYFGGGNRNASAHYFVDDKEIVQIVGDSRASWHCGDGRGKYGITNQNSLGVELCINSDSERASAIENLTELVKNLAKKFKIPPDRIVRHYDASRKNCPGTMSANNWEDWRKFKEEIANPIKIELDLSKDSVGRRILEDKRGGIPITPITKFESKNGLDMIITSPENIYQQYINKNIRSTGAYGINGTFYDTKRPGDPESICQISVNNGLPLSSNAQFNSYKGIKKGTFIIDTEGKVYVEQLASIEDFKKGKIDFAVGGIELLPNYNPDKEKTFKDILRCTWHTAIGYKKDTNKVYLITSNKMCSMYDFKENIRRTGIDMAVGLDGGGSTQMYYKDRGIHQTRNVATIIGVRRYSKGGIGNEY